MRDQRPSAAAAAPWRKQQLFAAILVALLSAAGTLGGLALYAKWRNLHALEAELAQVRAQLSEQLAQRLELEREMGSRVERGVEELERHRQALAEQRRLRREAEEQLARAAEELASLRQRYEEALRDLRAVAEGAASSEARLAQLAAERRRLEERVAFLEGQLARVLEERDMAQRNEGALLWRVQFLEQRLAEADTSRQLTSAWLQNWLGRQMEALETVLARVGLDASSLIERAGEEIAAGQGGPLEPADDEAEDALSGTVGFRLDDSLIRLRAAQQLLARLPLSPPLEEFRITSGFGTRRDPITGRPAVHHGIDFAAPRNAEVLAPAPGRVVEAGRSGAYGLMVEVDHGMGIVTRYGHLKKILVAVGDEVDLRQPLGIVGSTGRSTGRHLHYEIWVDGRPVDPGALLEAGRHLVDALKG